MSPANEDRNLAENSQANLSTKLDEAGKESFPTSDPVSVKVTRKAPTPANLAGNQDSSERDTASVGTFTEAVAEQVTDAAQLAYATAESGFSGAAEAAARAGRETYEQGRAYARRAAERNSAAGRYYATVQNHASENPVLVFLAGAAVGLVFAWLAKAANPSRDVPYRKRS